MDLLSSSSVVQTENDEMTVCIKKKCYNKVLRMPMKWKMVVFALCIIAVPYMYLNVPDGFGGGNTLCAANIFPDTSYLPEENNNRYVPGSATAAITHTLLPPAVVEVYRGGSLGPFHVEESNSSGSYTAFYVQSYLKDFDGTITEFDKTTTGLEGGAARNHTHYVSIPPESQLGTSTFSVKLTDVDGNLIDSDYFEFAVIAGSASPTPTPAVTPIPSPTPTPGMSGNIYGFVIDTDEEPVEHVYIRLIGLKNNVKRNAFSDADGFFKFSGLNADTYIIIARKKQFMRAKQTVNLLEDEEKEIEIKMKLSDRLDE
jgi:hypothetical protein